MKPRRVSLTHIYSLWLELKYDFGHDLKASYPFHERLWDSVLAGHVGGVAGKNKKAKMLGDILMSMVWANTRAELPLSFWLTGIVPPSRLPGRGTRYHCAWCWSRAKMVHYVFQVLFLCSTRKTETDKVVSE